MAAPQLPGGAAAPRTDTRGATRCWDEEPGLGDEAQDVRNAARSPRPAAPSPVFILLTITKAIYLFHLERDLVPVTSPECSVASASPAHVCLTRPPWAVSGVSPRGHSCLCVGPLTHSVSWGICSELPSRPLGELQPRGESLGTRGYTAVAAPTTPHPYLHLGSSIFAHGSMSSVFHGFLGYGFGLAFGFLTKISHVPLQKLWLSRGPPNQGGKDERVSAPCQAKGRAGRGSPERSPRGSPLSAQFIATPQSQRGRAGWGGAGRRAGEGGRPLSATAPPRSRPLLPATTSAVYLKVNFLRV